MKGNLKSHIQIKHGTENSFHCPHCDFKCASKTALRQHSREHQPTQPIQCSKCTYSCSSKGALKVHERIHSEERPFKCDFCNFASKQRSNLVIHKKKFHSDKPEKGGGGKGGRVGGKAGGGDSPKPVSSRYRAKLDAARAFRCDSCDASFVREDSLRSHRKQHRDTQNALQLHLSSQPGVVSLSPATASQSNTQLGVPVPADPLVPYSNAQLKIIVSHPLAQENPLIQSGIDNHQNKTNMVLLSPDNQDMVVSSMIQQVNLLAPMQPLGSSRTAGGTLEQQTVLLTQLSPEDNNNNNPLHQALLQTAITSQGCNSGTQTFITACSDLEGLNALIQEGGTEVTVVTEGNATVVTTATPPNVVCGTSEDRAKQAGTVTAEESALACEDGGLLVPNNTLGIQGVVIHSLPLIVSTQPQQNAIEQLSPHTLYSDSHMLEGIPQ